jgi:N-acetylglucosamine kinase-like BadF-type ATPase
MTRYVLGVDGGGTKTHAAIMDEAGKVCELGQSGPSNYNDVGVDQTRANIAAAVSAARRQSGLDGRPFAAAFLGMASVVSPTDRAIIHGIATDLALAAPSNIGVDHDCRVALADGLSGRPGIVLIAGTGSSCYGRNAMGDDWRASGWGYIISDEGSGNWLGVRAMESAVRAYDGRGAPTVLEEAVMRALGIDDMNDILHRLYVVGLSRAEMAALAPLVIDAARTGDDVALGIIKRGADELADCVLAVARRLGMAEDSLEVALVGGLFQAGAIVRTPLNEALDRRLPQYRALPAEQPPVVGACLLALQMV